MAIKIFDPTTHDKVSAMRGGGRIVQILKENLSGKAEFINSPENVSHNDTLLIPSFPLFTSTPPECRRALQKAKRSVLMIFDVIPLKYPQHFPVGIRGKVNFFFNKRGLKKVDTIVTISKRSKEDIVEYLNVSDSMINVVYPTLGKSFLKATPLEDTGVKPNVEKYCIYVGDVNWNKNIVNLARAIKIMNVTCMFVGKPFTHTAGQFDHPWQREFKKFLHETDGDKRFILKGYIPDKQLVRLYRNARCNISVSRDEGFGFAFLEAASQKTPSVLSDTTISNEVGDDCALYADPDNINAMADMIGQFYFNDDVRQKYSTKAYERSTYYSPVRFQQQMLKILQ